MPEPISLTTALILGASTLAASGVSAGVGAASAAKKRKSDKELGMKSMFSSSQPTGAGYSQGPNSIGSVIGAIGQAAGKVGKFAVENPELTKEVLGSATTIGSQLIENRQDKKQGPNMEKSRKRVAQDYARNAIVDRKEGRTKDANYEQKEATRVAAGEAPSMMGYNPISKHMGGRGANMYGDPMMKGENVIVRDAKSGGKNQYNKRGK